MIVLTENETGSSVPVALDAEIHVGLSENPTTGFQWQLVSEFKPFLSLKNSQYISSNPSTVGGGGYHQFVFQAKQKGKTEMAFELKRPWSDESLKSVSFFLEIS